MEPECNLEKYNLIKLIRKYKELVNRIKEKHNVDIENSNKKEFEALKGFYNEIQEKIVDKDSFLSLLGDKFEDECPTIEVDVNYDELYKNEYLEDNEVESGALFVGRNLK